MLTALPTEENDSRSKDTKKGRAHEQAEPVQLDLVADQLGVPADAIPQKRRRGRPTKAEAAARKAAQLAADSASVGAEQPSGINTAKGSAKERKAPERVSEEERMRRFLKLALALPHPVHFSARQAFEAVPELGYTQNASMFAKSGIRRGLVESVGDGIFRITANAVSEMQTALDLAPAPTVEMNVAPPPDSSSAPDAVQAANSDRGTTTKSKRGRSPKPAPVVDPTPASEPVAAIEAEPIEAPAPVETAAPIPEPAAVPVAQAPAPAAPAAAQAAGKSDDQVDTLMDLVDRYVANRFYRVRDAIVPLREFRKAVYGDAEIPAGEPPVCVVAEAYEPDPKVANPPDIDVLFLDAKGQAHLKSAASWWFVPYRSK
jgi:hypothetical protein